MERRVTPLAIFSRAPVPGRVKTGLTVVLGSQGAAHLQEAFLRDITDACSLVAGLRIELHIEGDLDHPSLRDLRSRLDCRAQIEGDLGVRMSRVLDAMVDAHDQGIVIASDAPTLPSTYIERAQADLEIADVVIGPTADGGFYILGTRVRLGDALDGVRWSTAAAYEDMRQRLVDRGLSVVSLPPWYDVDTPRELSLLRAHLESLPQAAPHTARILRQLRLRKPVG